MKEAGDKYPTNVQKLYIRHLTMDKIASQIKVLLLFGMVGVNEVGIRWKDNALIRGGLTDLSNSYVAKGKE